MSKHTAVTKPLRQVQNVQELLVNQMAQSQLQAVAAEHMKPERMMRLMANAIRTTPKLGQCDPLTLLGSMMTCASLGLEPNTVLGHAYLIPFENKRKGLTEVQLVLGYKGMVDLARRSGHVVNIHADVVYEADEFSFEYGSNQHLKHVPAGERSKPVYAYCHAKLTDGEAFIVLPYAEVLKVRNGSQGYKTATKYGKKDTPWIAHEHQMARKTAVRALFNELPISVEKVSDALQVDDNRANFANFAMHPEFGAPETGQTIEGEAVDEGQEETEATDEREDSHDNDAPEPAKKARGKSAKSQPEKTAEPESNEVDGTSGLVDNITTEINEAEDFEALNAVMEIYESQIAELEGTKHHERIMEAYDAREGALS